MKIPSTAKTFFAHKTAYSDGGTAARPVDTFEKVPASRLMQTKQEMRKKVTDAPIVKTATAVSLVAALISLVVTGAKVSIMAAIGWAIVAGMAIGLFAAGVLHLEIDLIARRDAG